MTSSPCKCFPKSNIILCAAYPVTQIFKYLNDLNYGTIVAPHKQASVGFSSDTVPNPVNICCVCCICCDNKAVSSAKPRSVATLGFKRPLPCFCNWKPRSTATPPMPCHMHSWVRWWINMEQAYLLSLHLFLFQNMLFLHQVKWLWPSFLHRVY